MGIAVETATVGYFAVAAPALALATPVSVCASIHRRMRLASAMRVYLPNELRNTMTTGRSSITASITRHCPASLV